jgi:hypothetical protein
LEEVVVAIGSLVERSDGIDGRRRFAVGGFGIPEDARYVLVTRLLNEGVYTGGGGNG